MVEENCYLEHCEYQITDKEFSCPKCGVGVETQTSDGLVVEADPGAHDDCTLLHKTDGIRCWVCGYEDSGGNFTAEWLKKNNSTTTITLQMFWTACEKKFEDISEGINKEGLPRSKEPWADHEMGYLIKRLKDEWIEMEESMMQGSIPDSEELVDVAIMCSFMWLKIEKVWKGDEPEVEP